MNKTVTESIYSAGGIIVPMADVQHIERVEILLSDGETKKANGIQVITKHTSWSFGHDVWDNPIYISEKYAEGFMQAWCQYRHELESSTLMDLAPQEGEG